MHKEQAKLVNAQNHMYKGTRQNSHVICAQTYTIKFFEFFTFLWFWIFTHIKLKQKNKIKCKNNQNNAYKEVHDAQMHDNEASNA